MLNKINLLSPTLAADLLVAQRVESVAGMHIELEISPELAGLLAVNAQVTPVSVFAEGEATHPDAFRHLRRYMALIAYAAHQVRSESFGVRAGRSSDALRTEDTQPHLSANPAGVQPDDMTAYMSGTVVSTGGGCRWQMPSHSTDSNEAGWTYVPRVKRTLPAWMQGIVGNNFTGNNRTVIQTRSSNSLHESMMEAPIAARSLTRSALHSAGTSNGAVTGYFPLSELAVRYARGIHAATSASSVERTAQTRREAARIMEQVMSENPDLFAGMGHNTAVAALPYAPWASGASYWQYSGNTQYTCMVTKDGTTTMCIGTRAEQEAFTTQHTSLFGAPQDGVEIKRLGAISGYLPCIVSAWRKLVGQVYDNHSEGRYYALGRNLLCVPLSLPQWRSSVSRVTYEGMDPHNTAIWVWYQRCQNAQLDGGAGVEALPLALVAYNTDTRNWSIDYLRGVVPDCPLTDSGEVAPDMIVDAPNAPINVDAKQALVAYGVSKAAATRALHLSFRLAIATFARAAAAAIEYGRVTESSMQSMLGSFCQHGAISHSSGNERIRITPRTATWLQDTCKLVSSTLSTSQRNALAGCLLGGYNSLALPVALGEILQRSNMLGRTADNASTRAAFMFSALHRGIYMQDFTPKRANEVLESLNNTLVTSGNVLYREFRVLLEAAVGSSVDSDKYRFVYCSLSQRVWLRRFAANEPYMPYKVHPSVGTQRGVTVAGQEAYYLRACVGCGLITATTALSGGAVWWSPTAHDVSDGVLCSVCRHNNYDTCESCSMATHRSNMFRTSGGGRVCRDCAPVRYTPCGNCGLHTVTSGLRQSPASASDMVCSRCHHDIEREMRQREAMPFGGYHQTRRNGNFFTERMAHSDDNTIPLGVELEVCCTNDDRDDVLYELGKKGYGHYFIAERDGSLSDDRGVEFVSAPMTREMWERVLSGKVTPEGKTLSLCADMLELGVRGYNVKGNYGTYGIHISVARHRLTPLQEARILGFLLASGNAHFVQAIAQRASIYGSGKQIGSGFNENATFRNGKLGGLYNEYMGDRLVKKPAGYGKYCPVNYKSTGNGMPALAEFRIFQSTLNEASFRKNLEFVWALIEWVQQPTGGSVNHIDFCAWLGRPENRKMYPNLVAYLLRDEYNIKGAKRIQNTWYGHISPPKKDRREPAVDEEGIEDAPTTMAYQQPLSTRIRITAAA